IEQASNQVSAAYGQVLRRPIATLTLLQRRPLVVGIAGEVNRPGSYTLTAENTLFPTLTQLLETAEGITQSADLRQVEVRRQTAQGSQTFRVDLWQLLESGDARYNIALRDGDSIFIPSTQVSLEEASLLANASFYASSTQPITVSVVGEVFRPGPYSLRGGATRTGQAGVPGGEVSSSDNQPVTVASALQVAGGIKPKANLRQVQVRRLTRSGQEQVIDVDLWQLLQTGDLRQNLVLQAGDTVFVPTATDTLTAAETTLMGEASFSPNTINVNVVGEVKNSGTVAVPPNTPLNQALLAAGGFNTRAREDAVVLVRLNPDGTVSRREVPIDFSQGVDEARNPLLQNNDIVIVGESGLANFSDTVGTVASPLGALLSIFGAPFRLFNLFR
ncbi:MAG TPA: SLBB domain-containing protein, partial [Leptolyngbyaceae cyanobacterium]